MVRRYACVLCLSLLLNATPTLLAQDLWLMKGHDVRRTGQSQNLGPRALDAARSWHVAAPGAMVLNVGASIDAQGVYVGSWGLLRRNTLNADPRTWDKSDGKLYGFSLDGDPLWQDAALDLDLVPRCYDYPGRGPNLLWCGFSPYEVSFYNGTVEGQAAIDTSRQVLYVGRGDGKLFAIDPEAGSILWRYRTFNPELPDDPDGGGELIASPLPGPDGLVYIGTWGEGDYETNAVYAIHSDSTLAWRYPAASSLSHRIFASPALSPDGRTLYVSTFRDDEGERPATLYAFHREPLGPVPDDQRLKWALDLTWNDLPVQTTTLAVGTDGTVYVGGLLPQGFGVPIVVAIEDRGDHGTFRWMPAYRELRDGAQLTLGLALREENGQSTRLYATTANLGTTLFNAKSEGTLYALDLATGDALASYDPSDDVPEAVGSLNSPAIDAAGTLFFGVRGRFGDDPINGYVFAVTYDAATATFARRWHTEVDGYVEWNHPAIGPDGGIYAGSSVNESTEEVRAMTYAEGTIPDGTTPLFYAFKGPTTNVATESPPASPVAFHLTAYPNPFTTSVSLALDLAGPGSVQVDLFDLLGRHVAEVLRGMRGAGIHTTTWHARDRLHSSQRRASTSSVQRGWMPRRARRR